MPSMYLEVPHTLTQEQALQRVKELLPTLKNDHAGKIANLRESWAKNRCIFSFTTMGFSIAGTLEVQAKVIVLQGTIPLTAYLFKNKIEESIKTKAAELLR